MSKHAGKCSSLICRRAAHSPISASIVRLRGSSIRASLDAVPRFIEMEQGPARKPYSLSWEEQDRLFRELPGHMQRIALYKVDTGCREQEVCQLVWDWEVKVPELDTSVFVLPSNDQFQTKNSQERIVVLNSIAKRVVDERRGKHPEIVFTYN